MLCYILRVRFELDWYIDHEVVPDTMSKDYTDHKLILYRPYGCVTYSNGCVID